MPSLKRKSSGNLILHVNPNRARSSSTRPLLSSKESGYGSTSLSTRDETSTLAQRSLSHVPESSNSKKHKLRMSDNNELLDTPELSLSPSTPLDDVFVDDDKTMNYMESDSTNLDDSYMSSIDRYIRQWSNNNKDHQIGTKEILEYIKTGLLFVFIIVCSAYIAASTEVKNESFQVTVSNKSPHDIYLPKITKGFPIIKLRVLGPFSENSKNTTDGSSPLVTITLPNNENTTEWQLVMNISNLYLGIIVPKEKQFTCSNSVAKCNMSLNTNFNQPVPIEYSYQSIGEQADYGIYYAAGILIGVYILIIFELVHRTVAAMLGSYAALAVLSALNERPSIEIVTGWIEMETIMLLFGMMLLVAIFAETGFFDYSALKVYQLAQGEVWPLVTLLCLFSAVVSAFLDNVTTILLLTPVTIRLCEVLNLDPKQILMAEVLFSNIGGTATAIGDPPNVIIVGAVAHKGISFSVFTVHMFCGILFIIIGAYGLLRFYYRKAGTLKNQDSPEIIELKHEIGLWKRAALRISVVTREESVMKVLFLQKSVELENELNRTLHKQSKAKKRNFTDTFEELKKKYCITDPWLLFKSGIVLSVVILILFIHSFVPSIHVGIGWTAVTGAVWLIILANQSDIENILHKVEWATLIFFAALFILMKALAELGLLDTIGKLISDMIESVEPASRTMAAISIILWISALASSFIDNIPYTTAMVPVLLNIGDDPNLDIPLLPLVLSLAFGACLGGNGTLIGASANVVCAGIAEQHGYGIRFTEFFKIGFPMMLVTTALAHVYLLICHVWIGWNGVNL